MPRLLVTVERDEAAFFKQKLQSVGWDVVHLPLEQYHYSQDPDQTEPVLEGLDHFQFVLYGGLRNARYFFQWVEEQQVIDDVQEMIHLALSLEVTEYLEARGIPVIVPSEGGKAIDLIEFLLRISVTGDALYPTVDGYAEEIPGLLEELGMACTELTVCSSVPLNQDKLQQLRQKLSNQLPDTILFHSRGSVIRIRTAFPSLDLNNCRLIAASEGVAWKMKQEGLDPDLIAGGSWNSVSTLLTAGTISSRS